MNPTPLPAPSSFQRRDAWILVGLALAVACVYAQVSGFGFLNWDDPLYIDDPRIRAGLRPEGIAWAFASTSTHSWAPLTLLSHMLDFTLFGANPGAAHLVNAGLHLANVLLCYRVLARLTGEGLPSAFVALLFAVHPLHVESVAWIAERKDVLSGLFLFLAIDAYAGYVRAPSRGRYLAVTAWFVLGLMSKPMLVTLPLLLLLLDAWPLGRMGTGNRAACLREKVPLLVLSLGFGILAMVAQGDALASLQRFDWTTRLLNALLSFAVYLGDFFAPWGLAPFYPVPAGRVLLLGGLGSLLLLGTLGWLAFRARRSAPYAATGLLWFLVSLLPVIGLVQVGEQAHADRYTYLPYLGLAIVVAWGLAQAGRAFPRAGRGLACLAGAWALALGGLAWRQAGFWKDSLALWQRAVAVTSTRAFTPAYNLGWTLVDRGRFQEGLRQYALVARTWPGEIKAWLGIGEALQGQGRTGEALLVYQRALQLEPGHPQALFRCAMACLALQQPVQARTYIERFFQAESAPGRPSRPDQAAGSILRTELGKERLRAGDGAGASRYFAEACRLDPGNPAPSIGHAAALVLLGRRGEGIAVLEAFQRRYGPSADVGQVLARLRAAGPPTGCRATPPDRSAPG